MKRHADKRSFSFKKVLRFTIPLLFLIASVSCCLPQGAAFWNDLLERFGFTHFTSGLPEDQLHIHVIDVGKADAILIESPDTAVLVDTGTADRSADVERYLSARGIRSLDAVWLSHADSDHAGGLERVLQTVDTDEIVCAPFSQRPSLGGAVQAAAGEIRTYGDLIFEVLGPAHAFESENDNSLVFRLRYGDFTMLFCGDIEETAEQELLDSNTVLQADVLKVAHHGSNTSTSSEFLQRVQPQYAVISVGEDRSNLPRNAMLKRLYDAGIPYYRTDKNGSVVISTNGTEIQVRTETAVTSADERRIIP